MARSKRKKIIVKKDDSEEDDYTLRTRRSSMRVNLSYVSNLSDSGHCSLKRTIIERDDTVGSEELLVQNDDLVTTRRRSKTRSVDVSSDIATPASVANVTVINAEKQHLYNSNNQSEQVHKNSLKIIKEKEQQLNKTCMQLKDAIMYKTQELFDKETELAIKTSEVLATSFTSSVNQVNSENNVNNKKTPSVKVNIGKNDQIIMSGDGRQQNPVEVSSMVKKRSLERMSSLSSDQSDENDVDCNQSIISTPKKSRTRNSFNRKANYGKVLQTKLRIPVVRLFNEDNDPNNSLSEGNPVPTARSPPTNNLLNSEINENNICNGSELTNALNNSVSPILSQGTRRSRLSCLSLKMKLTKPITQTSLGLPSNSSNESFDNRIPLTCSSFIDKQDKRLTKNRISDKKSNEKCKLQGNNCKNKTIAVDDSVNSKSTVEKDKSNNNGENKTIILDDNANSKTINIDNSEHGSNMDITTVSSYMPIVVRKSFQQVIRKSLQLDNIAITQENIKTFNPSTQQELPTFRHKNKESIKKINNANPAEHGRNDQLSDVDSSSNTVRSSLNVNTSLDQINSNDHIIQKENKKPNHLEKLVDENIINEVDKDDTVINQHESICTIRSSMQVNTSLDSVQKSSVSNTNNHEQSQCQRLSLNNEGKESSDKVVSKTKNSSLKKKNKNYNNNSSSRIVRRHSSTSNSAEKETNGQRTSRQTNVSSNQENSDKIPSRQPSTSTVRSSMQVNTSLDSARKSPITKTILDINKILSMVEETSINDNQSKVSEHNSKNELSVSDNELENISLIERIRNISASEKNNQLKEINQPVVNTVRKFSEVKARSTKNYEDKKNASSTSRRKSNDVKNIDSSTRKSIESVNISSTTNESSIVESTPYPTSRSVLLKTMIKNNIATNTLNAIKFVDYSDEETESELHTVIQKKVPSPKRCQSIHAQEETGSLELMDTVLINSSDESDKEKEPIIIDESLNETKVHEKSKNGKKSIAELKVKTIPKRKLYPLRENSQLVSFSPAEESQNELESNHVEKKKKRKIVNKKSQGNKKIVQNVQDSKQPNECEPLEDEILPKNTAKSKKPRKIISKKIVVKKVTNLTLLDNIMDAEEELTQRLSERNSLREFDLKRIRRQPKENSRKSSKIVIVVTGLPKEERDLVKSVVKVLGSAALEVNVTTRTTHVISSGDRTINLLKGIIRGCWLLTLEWALKSLESQKWLDPEPYEMSHYAKAVQENRRDRKLFGKAYVPDLFVTSGYIYIENGTSPPAPALKELVKIAGGRITEDPTRANIIIGSEGLKEIWILDSITTGETQPLDQYKRN